MVGVTTRGDVALVTLFSVKIRSTLKCEGSVLACRESSGIGMLADLRGGSVWGGRFGGKVREITDLILDFWVVISGVGIGHRPPRMTPRDLVVGRIQNYKEVVSVGSAYSRVTFAMTV